MSNDEVERLRKLRAVALRVRALARALDHCRQQPSSSHWLRRSSGAAWRISRAVSGQLRAHPCAAFQKDAGTLTVLANSLRAWAAARFLGEHPRASRHVARELSTLSRLLDDARALTCTQELSDSFGRSQLEIRGLLAEIGGRNLRPATTPELLFQPRAGAIADSPYLNL